MMQTLRGRLAPGAFHPLWMLAVLVALGGCNCGGTEEGSTPQEDASGGQAGTEPGGSSAPSVPGVTPTLSLDGGAEAVPSKITVRVNSDLLSPVHGELPPGTRLTLTPAVDGSWQQEGTSDIAFFPSRPLDYETEYSVRIDSLQTRDHGVLEPPAEDAWALGFRTPSFQVLRTGLGSFNAPERRVEVTITFSGPVERNDLERHAVWLVDGTPVANHRYATSGNSSRAFTATLSDPRLIEGRTVSLQLRSGIRSGQGTAPRYEADIQLPVGKRLHVRTAALLEGSSGFYVEVSCQDLLPNARPYQGWDGEEFQERYWGPQGCDVDADQVRQYLEVEPAVNVSVVPSRRGFRIFGDYVRGDYSLRLKPGLVSKGEGQLFNAYETRFRVPARSPQLAMAGSGRYLPRSAWRSLGISHLNVEQAELTVRRIPPSNLVFWLSETANERVTDRVGDVILRRKLALRGTQDTLTTTHVNLSDELPADTRGVLEVEVKQGNVRTASRLLLTDMSLVAKSTEATANAPGQVHVWALGMESNELLAGVDVQLVRRSGKVVAECKTGGTNGCNLSVQEDPLEPEAKGFALIARRGQDLTYLRFSDLQTEIADSDVQGESFSTTVPYRAAVWSDRGVYRPGDVAHLNALVRTREGVAPPAGMPTELQLIDPRGRTLKQQTLKTNAAGLVGMDVSFEAFADTGVYSARVRVAEKEIARYALNVEEFVPERMKVELQAADSGSLIGDAIPVSIAAEYLFGGSAEGSDVTLTCQLEEGVFRPGESADFTFGVWSREASKPVTLGQATGKLGVDGRLTIECPALSGGTGFRGPAQLVAQGAVFEAGSGRSTQNEVRVPVHPERYYLGLQVDSQKAEAGKPIRISGVVVDWNGKRTGGVEEVEIEAARLESTYGYWWDPAVGRERYTRQLRQVIEHRVKAKVVDGRFQVSVTPTQGSEKYLFRARSGKTQTDLVIDGQGYWYWGGDQVVDQTPRPLRATAIPLEVKGPSRVGAPVQVVAKLPYRGRVLFTAETDRVLAAEWKDASAGEMTWSFTPKDFQPNVYISAFLVKDPHLESKESFLPDRAFGVTHAMLEPTAFVQSVKLTAPSEVRSNQVMEVELDLGPREAPTFATVAAVDEGILQLTRFRSPDPISQLIVKRALGVKTFETLGWTMLSMPQGNSRSTGGAEDLGAAGRVQPVKPVALFSGIVEVPKSGKAKVRFEVPQYRGRLRVMAVTADARQVGRAEASVLVRDPITLQTTLPRFLSAQDQVDIPVFLTNLSGRTQDISVSLSAAALPVPGLNAASTKDVPLELLGQREGSVRIENGKSATLVFQARATQSIGAARLTVKASGGGFTSEETLDVPFAPSGPRERRNQRIELATGVNDLKTHLAGWVPTTERSTIWVTANPYGQSFDHLKYLVRYPHGCLEQVTSTVRPMLFASTVMESVDPTALGGQTEQFVQAGIQKVLAMQTPSGGFGYWPGANTPDIWATGYVTQMLMDAKDAGFEVPQERLDDAIAFAETAIQNASQTSRRYGVDASAYLHYVLARAGKGQKAGIQQAIDTYDGKTLRSLDQENLFLLKAALWLAGDRRYERDLKNADLSPVQAERSTGRSFYSDNRRRGLMLSTLEDLFPGDPATEPLAQLVAQALAANQNGRYYTTQELAWGITGLGKRLKGSAAKFGTPELMAGGKSLATKPSNANASDRTWALARASEYPTLEVKIEKQGQGKVYAVLSSEGVRENGTWRVGGEGLAIKRTWRTLDGRTVDPRDANQTLADLLYVQIELTNRTGDRIENIAMVDRLPAGWEIENPRLGRNTQPDWVNPNQQWNADYMSVRDDRLEMFGPLSPRQTVTVVYAVRAISSGVFTMPPVEAEAMYDPRIWAREAGGQVRIDGPWADFLL